VPPLQIDERQKRYKYINNNGFVKDPVALYKSAKNQVFWNDREKELFLDKLLIFGKNFEIIATFIDKKVTKKATIVVGSLDLIILIMYFLSD